jgi:hypothetical protein
MNDPLESLATNLLSFAKVMDARFEATQAQYATMMTHMEVIRAEIKNLAIKLNEPTKEKAVKRYPYRST